MKNQKEHIHALARANGFDSVGFAAPRISEEKGDELRIFLSQGYHGDMDWMKRRSMLRESPKHIWPNVQSIIILGHSYAPPDNPLSRLGQKNIGNISVYALGSDYHEIIKKKLKALARALQEKYGGEYKVFVDTAPIMEKPLAAQTAIGWQGKHSCVVSREFGNWLFLGEIFTTLGIEPDLPEENHCGTCSRCQDICPTQAFDAPYRLDARKCISYLTIEHKGHIPRQFRKAMGNRIYGCDDCLAVCPWNKFATRARESAYHARAELQSPALDRLAQLDDAAFRTLFSGSPIKRTGRDRFVRNVLIAIGNSENRNYVATIESRLHDDSPLVRAAAIWALGQLTEEKEFNLYRQKRLPEEKDADVIAEWNNLAMQGEGNAGKNYG